MIHFPTARQEDRIDRYEKHAEPIRCAVDKEPWPCQHVKNQEGENGASSRRGLTSNYPQ